MNRTTDTFGSYQKKKLKKIKSRHYLACDCEISLDVGDIIVVERSVVQEIKADSETIYVVKENYVYGRLEDETDHRNT